MIPIEIKHDKDRAYASGEALGYTCAGLLWTREGDFYGKHEYIAGFERIYKKDNSCWFRERMDLPARRAGPFRSLVGAMQPEAWEVSAKHYFDAQQRDSRPDLKTIGGGKYVYDGGGEYTLVRPGDEPA